MKRKDSFHYFFCSIEQRVESYQISGTEFHRGGKTCTDYRNIVQYTSLLLLLLCDSMCSKLSFTGDDHVLIDMGDPTSLHTMYGRVIAYPRELNVLEDLTKCFAELDDLHDLFVESLQTHCMFKAYDFMSAIERCRPSASLSRLVKGVLLSELRIIAEYYSGDDAYPEEVYDWVRLWLTILTFHKKIEIDRPDLVDEANIAFVAFEYKLQAQFVDGFTDTYERICSRMNALLKKTLPCDVSPTLVPAHGPGAVAGVQPSNRLDKYLSMKTDARIEYMLRKNQARMKQYNPFILDTEGTRINEFCTVPKTWKKRRGISKEPIELQFFQHAIKDQFYRKIEHNSWWSRHLRFSDQTRTRELAKKASLTQTHATIDLSAASDSVTLDMVKRAFKGTPLLSWLLATRSTATRVDGVEDPIRCLKFAPMGSATCFLVESMVFTMVTYLAVIDSWRSMKREERTIYRDCWKTFYVYGDDIILPTFAVGTLYQYLAELGFSINIEKSFDSGWYREACGVEAWCGLDITPVKYKKLFTGHPYQGTIIGDDVSRVVSLVNRLDTIRAHHTSREILSTFGNMSITMKGQRFSGWDCVTFTDVPSRNTFRIRTPYATNYRLKHRFVESAPKNSDQSAYQTDEVRLLIFVRGRSRRQRHLDRYLEPISEKLRLLEWFLHHQQESEDDQTRVRMHSDSVLDNVGESHTSLTVGDWMIPTLKWVITEVRE